MIVPLIVNDFFEISLSSLKECIDSFVGGYIDSGSGVWIVWRVAALSVVHGGVVGADPGDAIGVHADASTLATDDVPDATLLLAP